MHGSLTLLQELPLSLVRPLYFLLQTLNQHLTKTTDFKFNTAIVIFYKRQQVYLKLTYNIYIKVLGTGMSLCIAYQFILNLHNEPSIKSYYILCHLKSVYIQIDFYSIEVKNKVFLKFVEHLKQLQCVSSK